MLGTGAGELEPHPANATIDPSATQDDYVTHLSDERKTLLLRMVLWTVLWMVLSECCCCRTLSA